MTVYIESSAYLKLFFEEPDAVGARARMDADADWVTARHTAVEVRRNLARHLRQAELDEARRLFQRHWARTRIVELDETTCELAGDVAESTGVRTLDALHLAAARQAGGAPLLTFDIRLAQAARSLGMTVVGI